MATARSIASMTLGFGLVSIPIRLFSATEPSGTVRFNMLAKDGSRLKQQYVSATTGKVVERADMVKGYEFEKDRFVLFTPAELKVLDEGSSASIDIVAFVPEKTVDPIYYDKAYLLAPDKRGAKPYALLAEAMRESGRCALARWAWKGKKYVVQVRPAEDGLILQQLLYADEVRSLKDLDIEQVTVSKPELQLALQLIDQISVDAYDPQAYKDDEKDRVLAQIDAKIAGEQVVANAPDKPAEGAQVIDLMAALRASLGNGGSARDGDAKPAARRGKATPREAAAPAEAEAAAPTPAPDAANVRTLRPAARKSAAEAAPADAEAAPAARKGAKRAAPTVAAPAAPAAPEKARARR